jgi:hypothetical protein
VLGRNQWLSQGRDVPHTSALEGDELVWVSPMWIACKIADQNRPSVERIPPLRP